jgi:Sulfatase
MRGYLPALAISALLASSSVYAQSTPNVVIMLADNVGYDDLGPYGAGEVRGMPTPQIDQFASEGLRLTQFLCEPGCTPSRAALLLGRYSPRAGLGSIIIGGTPNTLQAKEVTMAQLFKSKGYDTAITGKWHLGSEEQSLPTNHGFDEYAVGVIETTDGTLYREAMQRDGLPDDVIAKRVPRIRPHDAQAEASARIYDRLSPPDRGGYREIFGRLYQARSGVEETLLSLCRLYQHTLPVSCRPGIRR